MQGRESERAALARYLPGMVQADGPFQGDPILTDDFAPTDSMAAR
jgi:hypothetical protein